MKIPLTIRARLENVEASNVRVLVGKRVSREAAASGTYAHLGLGEPDLVTGNHWECLPPGIVGRASHKNREGWQTVRRDLPKHTKYFYRDIQNFGDASRNGWSTVAIPREVYEKEYHPAYLFQIEIAVQEELGDGEFGVIFSVDEVFAVNSPTFEQDMLFALNLLQENAGEVGVVPAENPEFVFTSSLNWTLFPPGSIEKVADAISSENKKIEKDTVLERLKLFEQFEPTEYLKGLGGNDYYIGAKFADDLVAFENLKYGNALYVLYSDWQSLSERPRSEILKLADSKFDRIVHTDGWENRFAVLMQNELHLRGIRVRIGRNRRRRRK